MFIPSPFQLKSFRACLVLLALPGGAAAEGALPETPGVSSGAMLQMLLWLALVLAFLFIVAWLLRRINGGRAFGGAGPVRVVGGLMLGPRERVVLLEIEETWLVVGIVPGQIKTLHTLPRGEPPAARDAENRFGAWLKQVTERRDESL